MDIEQLYQAVLMLSNADRIALVTRLLEELPAEDVSSLFDDPDFVAELERRANEDIECIPWSVIQKKLKD